MVTMQAIDSPATIRPWDFEPSFQDILAEQLRKAPWVLISLAGHFLIFAVVFLAWQLTPSPENLPAPPPLTMSKSEADEIVEPPPEEEVVEQLVPKDLTEQAEVIQDDIDMAVDVIQGADALGESYEGRDHNFEGQGMGGGGGGKRGGRIGSRGPLQRGGGGKTAAGVRDGLRWLAKHQDDDGHWDCDGFEHHCPAGAECSGPGGSLYDVGVSGLALLAFLGDGHHPNRRTAYQRAVTQGVYWLVDQMEEGPDDGLIGGRSGHAFLYNHSLAALALCEAYVLSRAEELREPAQRAVNFILRARNPYKAWRYEAPPNGENDTSITGWMVFALATAQDAGLDIDTAAFEGARAWFDEVSDSGTGRCGYIARGEASARPLARQARFPSAATESLTAVALLCRIFMGETPESNPLLEQHADLCLSKLPTWSADGSTNDLYYWYYGTFAMYQMGKKYWKRWDAAMKKALIGNQRRDGHASGSWDPNGPWGEDGGRVYSTAMGVLCLEVYYRYTRLIGNR